MNKSYATCQYGTKVDGHWYCRNSAGHSGTRCPCDNWKPMNDLPSMTKTEPTASTTQVGGNHYKDYAIQPCEFLRRNNVPHAEGEVIYKVLRHRQKNGREDLEKAIHAIQLIIDMDYPT